MGWTASFDPRAFAELGRLDRGIQKRIVKFLEERVTSREHPQLAGKPLTGDKAGLWRYRVGDYRLICLLEQEKRNVMVLRVAHRREAYR